MLSLQGESYRQHGVFQSGSRSPCCYPDSTSPWPMCWRLPSRSATRMRIAHPTAHVALPAGIVVLNLESGVGSSSREQMLVAGLVQPSASGCQLAIAATLERALQAPSCLVELSGQPPARLRLTSRCTRPPWSWAERSSNQIVRASSNAGARGPAPAACAALLPMIRPSGSRNAPAPRQETSGDIAHHRFHAERSKPSISSVALLVVVDRNTDLCNGPISHPRRRHSPRSDTRRFAPGAGAFKPSTSVDHNIIGTTQHANHRSPSAHSYYASPNPCCTCDRQLDSRLGGFCHLDHAFLKGENDSARFHDGTIGGFSTSRCLPNPVSVKEHES